MALVWNLFNDLSVLMSFAMISIPVPGIASLIQKSILTIIFLDVTMTNQWLVPYLTDKNIDDEGVSPIDNSHSIYFDTAGFSSSRMLLNLGSTLIYLLLFLTALLIYGFLKFVAYLWPR